MQQEIDRERLLTVREVAARLRLSRSAVYKMISNGSIPFVNLAQGDRMVPRVREDDLKEFIRERTRRSALPRSNERIRKSVSVTEALDLAKAPSDVPDTHHPYGESEPTSFYGEDRHTAGHICRESEPTDFFGSKK